MTGLTHSHSAEPNANTHPPPTHPCPPPQLSKALTSFWHLQNALCLSRFPHCCSRWAQLVWGGAIHPTTQCPPPQGPRLLHRGHGPGSFDFPLVPGADDTPTLPFFFHPSEAYGVEPVPTPLPNSLALDLLPSSDPTDAVLAWIEGISATSDATMPECTTTPKKQRKRRRSFNQDDDEAEERPRRAWSPTIDPSFIPNNEHREEEPLEDADSRAEPEAPG
ncbi:hypothetical protein CPB84DRAFT_1752680 [Gymnopilus junonius]|uniref:Uncharacterized protein n=1 Tax=Gymnopilus junonius TaxID=109634 RepID=A0A9P5TFS2_GYMJU|nr:hypothetical protein CPB84DRAFT_1752680 [Gymnopilus junonius]